MKDRQSMGNIAIIPARSGSKGLKDKNIRLLNGKPLIAYTIEAAIKSGEFDEVMVSTDSERYAEISKQYGAAVPFLRSEENAADSAGSWDVVDEVLQKYEEAGRVFDTVCLLQPTSPLRSGDDIREAYALFREKADFAVVSVCEAEHSPLWCGQLPENKEFVGFIDESAMKQRQAGGRFYRLNGALYIVSCKRLKESRYLYQKGSFAYVMSQSRSVDIDTELDFRFAELLMQEGANGPDGQY